MNIWIVMSFTSRDRYGLTDFHWSCREYEQDHSREYIFARYLTHYPSTQNVAMVVVKVPPSVSRSSSHFYNLIERLQSDPFNSEYGKIIRERRARS